MLNFSTKNLRKALLAFPSIAAACRVLESILTYVTKTKDVKAAQAGTRQIEARAKKAILPKHGH